MPGRETEAAVGRQCRGRLDMAGGGEDIEDAVLPSTYHSCLLLLATTSYYCLLLPTTYLRPTTACYHLLLPTTAYYFSLPITTYHCLLLPTTYCPYNTHPTYPPIHPSTHSPTHSPTQPLTHPSTRPPNHPSTRPLTHPSTNISYWSAYPQVSLLTMHKAKGLEWEAVYLPGR